jgi:Protein of unknown function (DUF2865)
LRTELAFQRNWRRSALIIALAGSVALAPDHASAEGLFDFFFGGAKPQTRPASPPQPAFNSDPASTTQQPAPLPPRSVVAGPAFCVRSCDGRYFPLTRGNASPIQMCQAFCPASPTKVFYGSSIDSAYSQNGERYAESANAFAYRKALRADCTCNGRDPAGLAPIDLALDSSLRPGDVIATTDGLVAYSGVRIGNDLTPEYTPVASYPGLTAEVRAHLNEMKVAPVRADIADDPPTTGTVTPAVTPAPKPDKRAEAN